MIQLMRNTTIRWHTYRVVIMTSLVWCIVFMCVLLYYIECLANNQINCRKDHIMASITENKNKIQLDNSLETNIINNEIQFSFSVTYLPEVLKSWSKPVIETNPTDWLGENGKPVIIGEDELELKKKKYEINKFNLLASERIALNRSVPDVRLEGCKDKVYPKLLPTTSIVIVFHNEAWSTLLRTVHSIIRMSPKELVREIILVDDASERDFLGKKLEDYVSKLSVPVNVVRTGNRSGLIRARLMGAQVVKGEVITFLDAHCECNKGWLEPLLARIVEDRTRVVCPIIDVISEDTFAYMGASDMTYGGFNWRLNFRWFRVPQRELKRRNNDKTLPVRSPTMAGGLFAIDKQYFEYIGKYDEGMKIWGGENLELSFRIWMCGGSLEIVTCSHVGHVFRKSTPYTFPGGTSFVVNHNNARLADVWLDEWKDFYYSINPGAKKVEMGDTEPRKELRRRLQCKDFRWYLTNIYPESQMPIDYYSLGEIKNLEINKCLDTFRRKSGQNIGMASCHGKGGNQLFSYTKKHQIMSDDNCLDATKSTKPVKLVRCHGMGGNQVWEYKWDTKTLVHKASKLCLEKPEPKDPKLPLLKHCNGRKSQKWIIKNNYKWQLKQ